MRRGQAPAGIYAADKRLQAHTRTRFIVCVTIAPRSYFTDICRIPYRNAPFLPHPRRGQASAGIYANSVYCIRHYRAAILLYRYLPHTVPQCTVPPSPTPHRNAHFFIFYMVRAGRFCCALLHRRARNRKAMRNLSALSVCDNCSQLPRAGEKTSRRPPTAVRT